MNISSFFIKRPIFAAVIFHHHFRDWSARLFPPSSERVSGSRTAPLSSCAQATPGANPTVIADTVASPLEQQINGVEGMLYNVFAGHGRRRDDL